MPGKGGWTYISLPDIPRDKDAPFGLVKVRGTIDGYEIKNHSLMPFGNGNLLLALKAAIRKAIGKEEGDYVQLTLYKDTVGFEIPEALKLQFEEAGVYQLFTARRKWEQKMCTDWIFSAKRETTTTERILRTIFRLRHREKII